MSNHGFSIPHSSIIDCPRKSLAPAHWDHYQLDGKCNCGRVCGYSDEHGGPCILLLDEHPKRHDDGQRSPGWQR